MSETVYDTPVRAYSYRRRGRIVRVPEGLRTVRKVWTADPAPRGPWPGAPRDLPDLKHRNRHGRVVFDDPEVEEINRFIEENGPLGRGFSRGKYDVERVRELTGNPNFGKPRREWR